MSTELMYLHQDKDKKSFSISVSLWPQLRKWHLMTMGEKQNLTTKSWGLHSYSSYFY